MSSPIRALIFVGIQTRGVAPGWYVKPFQGQKTLENKTMSICYVKGDGLLATFSEEMCLGL